jgi:hypothetical protein
MVSAMSPCLAIIIEEVCISRTFEYPETDLQLAASACCADFADNWSSKRVH